MSSIFSKFFQGFLAVIILGACSETPYSNVKPNDFSDYPENNRATAATFLESDNEVPKVQDEYSYDNLAAWVSWNSGQTIRSQNFIDPRLLESDRLAESLDFKAALVKLSQVQAQGIDQLESLEIRKSSWNLLLGKSSDAILGLSNFYQKQKFSEADVASEASLLFGFAYGQAGNFEQSLAWMAQAQESKNPAIKVKTREALKRLLRIMPEPILEKASFTWRSNYEFAKLFSEERYLRTSRPALNISKNSFFWLPSASAETKTETAVQSFSSTQGLKVAAMLPLSGKLSKMGEAVKNGMEIALQHSNARGTPLEINFADSEASEGVSSVIDNLVNSGAEVLVGPLVSEIAQEVEIIAREKSLPAMILAKGGSATIGEGVYRFGLTNENQAESLVSAILPLRPSPRIALIYPEDDFGLGFSAAIKESLQRRQISPLYDLSYAKGDQAAMNEKAKEFAFNPPEFIIFADNIKSSFAFVSALDEGVKKRIIPVGSALWDNPLELIRSKSALGKAVFVSAFYPDVNSNQAQQFVADFKSKFNKTPDFFAAQGYDTANILSQSSASSGQINFPSIYDGVSGRVQASSSGELERQLRVLQLSKGTIQPLSSLPQERSYTDPSSQTDFEVSPETKQFSDPVVSE
jgi:branched-chain amino acid transport system substrate-binding protein